MIDAAVAAGRVTRVEAGHAAGLTQIEGALGTCPPPLPEGGWRQLQDIKKKAAIQAYHRAKAAAQ